MFAKQPLNDNSLMPFGMHRGKKLANVPAKYLLWLYNNGCSDPYVKNYIVSNLEILKKEVQNFTTYKTKN